MSFGLTGPSGDAGFDTKVHAFCCHCSSHTLLFLVETAILLNPHPNWACLSLLPESGSKGELASDLLFLPAVALDPIPLISMQLLRTRSVQGFVSLGRIKHYICCCQPCSIPMVLACGQARVHSSDTQGQQLEVSFDTSSLRIQVRWKKLALKQALYPLHKASSPARFPSA